MTIEELVTEWNWDFDPDDPKDLDYAVNEMIGFLEEQEPEYLVQLLRPLVQLAIVEDLTRRIENDEEDERK